MLRFNGRLVGVERGSVLLFSDFEEGGQMWTGSGARETRRQVEFSEKFRSEPVVHISMSMWDMDQMTNPRADISTGQIHPGGFEVVFRTWGDTRIARIRADWLAIGELPDPDAWDVT